MKNYLFLLPLLFLAGCATIAGEYVSADEANQTAYAAFVGDVTDNALRPKHVVDDARTAWGEAGALFAQAAESEDSIERNSLEIAAIEKLIAGVTQSFLNDEQRQLWLDNLASWRNRIEAARKAAE